MRWHLMSVSVGLLACCVEDDPGPRPVSCPNLAVTPDVLTWPATLTEPMTQTVAVTNACGTRGSLTGTASLVSDDFVLDAGEQVSFSLLPERTATLDITYFPSGLEVAEAELVLVTNAEDTTVVPLVATSGLPDTAETGERLPDTAETEPDTEETGLPTDSGISDRYGDVLITEVLFDAASVRDRVGEFIELRNMTDDLVDLAGWTLSVPATGASLPLDEDFSIIGGRHAALSPSGDLDENGGVDADYLYDRDLLPLPNRGGTLELRDADGLFVASAVVTDGVTSGVAMGLDPDFSTPAAAANPDRWCAQYWQMSGGDYGTPRVTNNDCDAYDRDEDGDGYTALDDCDDDDADVNPGEDEQVLNGKDDDCDGEVDVVSLASATVSTLDGDGQDYLAYRNNIGAGDVDGDGAIELIVGGYYLEPGTGKGGDGYAGAVVALETAGYASWSGEVFDAAAFTIEGTGQSQFLGAIAHQLGDVTGDGFVDLVVAGSDTGTSDGDEALVVYAGGSSRSGLYDGGDEAVLVMTDSAGQSLNRPLGYADLDGDGVAEIVYGEPFSDDGVTYAGRVSLLQGGEWSGTGSFDDADAQFSGPSRLDYLGSALGGGDLDGDGYDELLIGAPGDDDNTYESGAIYILAGGSVSGTGSIATATSTKWTGARADKLGTGPEPCLADLDGDGDVDDVAVAGPDGGVVYVVHDAGSAGSLDLSTDADLTIEARRGAPDHFGIAMACGDVDGNGQTDLVVGAPDDDTELPSYWATQAGEVYVFTDAVLHGASALDETDSRFTVRAPDALGFGQTLLALDLDGDGDDEILANEPNHDTDAGRLYVLDVP